MNFIFYEVGNESLGVRVGIVISRTMPLTKGPPLLCLNSVKVVHSMAKIVYEYTHRHSNIILNKHMCPFKSVNSN